MSDNTDIRISPTLHPDLSAQIEDYDEETRPLLGQAETAASMAFEALKSIHDAKAAAATNKTLTPMAQLVLVDDHATKRMTPVMQAWGNAVEALNNNIQTMEKELRAPVEQKASQAMAAEIRAHFKSMDKDDIRIEAIQRAIEDGDERTVTAICGAPGYLSGFDDAMHSTFTREWNEKVQPLTAKKVRAMRAAADLLNDRVKLLKKAHTDAVGVHEEFKEDRQGRQLLVKRWTPDDVREMVRKANIPFAVPVGR